MQVITAVIDLLESHGLNFLCIRVEIALYCSEIQRFTQNIFHKTGVFCTVSKNKASVKQNTLSLFKYVFLTSNHQAVPLSSLPKMGDQITLVIESKERMNMSHVIWLIGSQGHTGRKEHKYLQLGKDIKNIIKEEFRSRRPI